MLTLLPKEALKETRKKWRQPNESAAVSAYPVLDITVISSFSPYPIDPYLGTYVNQLGYQANLHHAPYNQIIQSCLNYVKIGSSKNMVVLIWRLEDYFLEEFNQWLYKGSYQFSDIEPKLTQLQDAITHLIKHHDATFIMALPGIPQLTYINPVNLQQRAWITAFQQETCNTLRKWATGKNHLTCIDLGHIQAEVGLKQSFDARSWYLFKQPWTEELWSHIAFEIARQIKIHLMPGIKCLALDCDNVLWGGIVGEDGIWNIRLSEDYPGAPFKEVQRFYKALQARGIFLTLLSKNNPQDVLEIFEKHPDMILKKEDISTYEISWNPKHEGVKKIAKRLNIGVESIVFIDDSPHEIQEMQHFCPEAISLLRPENIDHYLPFIVNNTHFDFATATQEDLVRNQMIAQELKRQEMKSSLSEEAFLDSLKLQITLEEHNAQNHARIVQLLHKTNQFNLSTKRYTAAELIKLADNENAIILCLSANDKFGQYGIVGVAIALVESETAIIDSFLLSCRILGRQVETAFLVKLIEYIVKKNRAIKKYYAEFVPTSKNEIVPQFLKKLGFTPLDHSRYWCAEIGSNSIKFPNHIKILSDPPSDQGSAY
jgi:FkbH-like protein